jgi:hypothetical protein
LLQATAFCWIGAGGELLLNRLLREHDFRRLATRANRAQLSL